MRALLSIAEVWKQRKKRVLEGKTRRNSGLSNTCCLAPQFKGKPEYVAATPSALAL